MKKKNATLRICSIALDQVNPCENNPKRHSPEQVEQIAASIQAFGFNDPVAVDENDNLLEGHGRLLAAKKLDLEKIPVIRLEHLSDAEKTAYRLAHNKLTLNTGLEPDLLRVEFEALKELDFEDLSLTGFREREISLLFELSEIPDSELDLAEPEEEKEESTQVTCPACHNIFYV